MPKAAHEWDMCKGCTHTVNIHTDDDGKVAECRAHNCECEGYVKK